MLSRGRTIDVSWSSRQLQKACSTDKAGTQHWGPDQWKILRRRLVSLLAAGSLRDMAGVPGKCHALTSDRRGQFALALWGQYRLVFEPDQDPVPRLPDGAVDEAAVARIRVLEVVDYHGG